mmetsp:Transcript_3135/g.6751  ORF Transcript_3135/g.6751 Transcript_3135/m.6751 type:complete len:241 (-) Transcript_3135:34-756(-)|eukprot:CAMPEP_0183297068 /NCGR_PEP_ID=MMETSP0160_2-20130417/4445_1 /TAXON_ID=2839 ORGANISM="Odontella Sinensis, Strain Grunow 1884" /NCGR_SAMPLE_ID=MMETSP0160_2 /ASSEMBLY_ACC=CAM_ASM_000250 /LENGTH=240 /DNA_ID=CAMNT_0025458807 /DNA_START=431 /DNA_END=1153 /DNA_ORIENTATION=-
MKLGFAKITSLAVSFLVLINTEEAIAGKIRGKKDIMKPKTKKSKGETNIQLAITNLALAQPFSPFFVMVHSKHAKPLYTLGAEPSEELAMLAENGNPGPLVEYYNKDENVLSVEAFNTGAPYTLGGTFYIDVDIMDDYEYITIASMAIHTNDCFVALNGVKAKPGSVYDVNGLDAGSEENNEDCGSIPGPSCNAFDTNNERSGNGEGYVHVHRGFFGLGDLPEDRYDWRNPMMRVSVTEK